MKISPTNFERGRVVWIVAVALAALLFVIVLILLQSRASVVLPKKQADFIEAMERRNPARLSRLLAEDYSDRWGFDSADAVETIVDVGSQFLVLVVRVENQEIEFQEESAMVRAELTIGGTPVGPGGNEVMRRINRLDAPFVFTWQKQNFLPSSWRIVAIENPDLPDELYGYEPGDIRRAMQGESSL